MFLYNQDKKNKMLRYLLSGFLVFSMGALQASGNSFEDYIKSNHELFTPSKKEAVKIEYSVHTKMEESTGLGTINQDVEMELSAVYTIMKNNVIDMYSNKTESFTIVKADKKIFWDEDFKPAKSPIQNIDILLSKTDTILKDSSNNAIVFTMKLQQQWAVQFQVSSVKYTFNNKKVIQKIEMFSSKGNENKIISTEMIFKNIKRIPITNEKKKIRKYIFSSNKELVKKYKGYTVEGLNPNN